MSLSCKSCGAKSYVRNGKMRGEQRYKCKECGYNFIEGDKRIKYGLVDRLKVLKLYLENCGIRSIERLTGIRNRQISLWIEDAAASIKAELKRKSEDFKDIKEIEILEIDELCTYIKKDLKTGGNSHLYGLLLIENQVKLLTLK